MQPISRYLPFRTKVALAFGLNLFFYPVQVYVNHIDQFEGLYGLFAEGGGILVTEYIAGSLAMLVWLLLAEGAHRLLEHFFGEYLVDQSWRGMALKALSVAIFLGILYGMFVGTTSVVYVFEAFTGKPNPNLVDRGEEYYRRFRFGFSIYSIFALLVFYLMLSRRMFHKIGETRRRTEQAEHAQVRNRYQLLRGQVNPHFLFNCLSTLSSLVNRGDEQSEQFVVQMARAYRYMLDQREALTVPLRAEWDFLQTLKYLLETRYAGKLYIELPPPPEGPCRIAPLSTQILVEYAVKHHRMSASSPLVIRFQLENGALTAETRAQWRPEPNNAMEGGDLARLEARYAALNGRAPHYAETDGVVIVRVPLLTADHEDCLLSARLETTIAAARS